MIISLKSLAALTVLLVATATPALAGSADGPAAPPPAPNAPPAAPAPVEIYALPAPCAPVVVAPCRPCDPCGPWWAPKRLHGEIGGGFWLVQTSGQMGIGTGVGTRSDFDTSFSDAWDMLSDEGDSGWMGSAALGYGRWRLSVWGTHLRFLEEDTQVNRLAGTVEGEYTVVQANLGYRVSATPLSCDACSPCVPTLLADVFVGARFWRLDLSQTNVAGVNVSEDRDVIDPLVGGRLAVDFRNGWLLDLEADIGGFGIGSDFTWRLRAGVEWAPARWIAVQAGYMFLDTSYTTGSGAKEFSWNALIDGPYLGLTFRF